eukprot:m51a1_g5812 hypothetical protein (130) ;mRNA; r:154847-161765
MSLSQINAQYKFGEITNISFSNIFSHVFEHVIQAIAQQYMAAKKHSCSTIFEQEIPIICYRSGSNASYLQLNHNHCIIFILFIHIMEHYNFQLPAISDEFHNIEAHNQIRALHAIITEPLISRENLEKF